MTRPSSTDHDVVEPAEMRRVLGHFATGVTVVTGGDADAPQGFVCQSFTSVSLDPPLVLICPAHTSTSWPLIAATGSFTVNVLGASQAELCKGFATSGGDKFAGVAWDPTPWGPALDGVLATVHCDLEQVHAAGDHDVVLGRVRRLVTHSTEEDVEPMLFFKGRFGL